MVIFVGRSAKVKRLSSPMCAVRLTWQVGMVILAPRGEVPELAEGARLEIVCPPKRRTEGSNPSLSARILDFR